MHKTMLRLLYRCSPRDGQIQHIRTGGTHNDFSLSHIFFFNYFCIQYFESYECVRGFTHSAGSSRETCIDYTNHPKGLYTRTGCSIALVERLRVCYCVYMYMYIDVLDRLAGICVLRKNQGQIILFQILTVWSGWNLPFYFCVHWYTFTKRRNINFRVFSPLYLEKCIQFTLNDLPTIIFRSFFELILYVHAPA